MEDIFAYKVKDIQDIALKTGVELEKNPEDFYTRRKKNLFTTPARLKNGNKIVFRYAFGNLLSSIKREIELYSIARDIKVSCVPKMINHGAGSAGYWMIYEYNDGQPVGTVYQFASDAPFEEIINSIIKIPSISKGNMNTSLFRSYNERKWNELIDIICQKNVELSKTELVMNLLNVVSKQKTPVSDCFCHGDIHPQNIINTKSGIVFIDWESSHFNSCAFDLSFVYIRAYNQKERDKIIRFFEQEHPGKCSELYFCIAVNLLRDYFEWHNIVEGKSEVANMGDLINGRDINWIYLDLENQIKYMTDKLLY